MSHKIDPYTGEVIEYDMEVDNSKIMNLSEDLNKYFTEYMEILRKSLNDKFDECLVSLEKGDLSNKAEMEYADCVKKANDLAQGARKFIKEAIGESMCENAGQEHGIMPHPRFKYRPLPPTPYERKEPMSFSSQLKPIDVDKAIADAIGKAVRHAERISKRDHIMADRVERVNLFITSLRREFGYLDQTITGYKGDLTSSLCRKELWYDAGVMNLSGVHDSMYGCKYTRDQIQKWIDEANRQRNSTEAARYQIESDLEELERGLTGCSDGRGGCKANQSRGRPSCERTV